MSTESLDNEPKEVNHIIGCARTIQTAVLVVEYLRTRSISCGIHGDMIRYAFKEPTAQNGNWSADIIVKTHSISIPDLKQSHELVEICRAFVAGRGEIWG